MKDKDMRNDKSRVEAWVYCGTALVSKWMIEVECLLIGNVQPSWLKRRAAFLYSPPFHNGRLYLMG